MPRSSSQMPIAVNAWNIVISTAAPSTIAASTTWPLPVRLGLEEPHDDAEGEEHPAAAEVADEVERRAWAGRPRRPMRSRAPASAM